MKHARGREEHPACVEPLESRVLLAAIWWDGGGDGVNWRDPINWSGDNLPQWGDDATIDVPGEATIVHATAWVERLRTLTCAESLVLIGGEISTDVSWLQTGSLTVAGATVSGAGNLIIGASATWSGGAMQGAGQVRVRPGAVLTIAGDVTLARTLVNNGTLVWAGGDVRVEGAAIYNLAGRVFQVSAAGEMVDGGGGAVLYNGGTIRTYSSATIGVRVETTNLGALWQVDAGTLTLRGGARLGDVVVAGGLTLAGMTKTITGTTLRGSGSVFGLMGTLQLEGGGHTFAGQITQLATLVINSATVNIAAMAGAQSVKFNGGLLIGSGNLSSVFMDWDSGVVAMAGRLVSGMSLRSRQTSGIKHLRSVLEVNGDAAFSGGMLHIDGGTLVGGGSVFMNTSVLHWVVGLSQVPMTIRYLELAADAVVNLARNTAVVSITREGSATFHLQGATLTFHGGVLQSGGPVWINGTGAVVNYRALDVRCDLSIGPGVAFTNVGQLRVAGHFRVPGSAVTNLAGGVLSGGRWIAAGAGTLDLVGAAIVENQAEIMFGGMGRFPALTAMQTNKGFITLFNGAQVTLTPAGGVLRNVGGSDIASAVGVVHIDGAFEQTAAGVLGIMLDAQRGSGRLIVAGGAVLAGNVFFQRGDLLTMSPGLTFNFLSAGTVSGQFLGIPGTVYPPWGAVPLIEYLATGVRLRFV
jgi:hypothetical protein